MTSRHVALVLTVREFAELVRMSPEVIRRRIREGHLVCKNRRIPTTELRKFGIEPSEVAATLSDLPPVAESPTRKSALAAPEPPDGKKVKRKEVLPSKERSGADGLNPSIDLNRSGMQGN